jgi:hypothetical protein
MSKEAAFLQGVTRTASTILDRLLGHKLLSIQSVAVSMAFSMASYMVFGAILEMRDMDEHLLDAADVVTPLILLFLGSIPAFAASESPRFRLLLKPPIKQLYQVVLIVFVICSPLLKYGIVRFAINDDVVVLLGVPVDFLFIVFFRWVLKRVAQLSRFWAIVLYLIATCCVAALLIGPFFLNFSGRWSLFEHADIVGFVSATTLVDALCLLLLISIMLLLLAHRLVWPFMERLVYAVNRKQLIKNTKLLGALGTMLLLYAFPNNPVVQWITHFLPNLRGG